jgi:hypothetical protein
LGDDAADADPNIIKVPTNGIQTTDNEFEKLGNATRKNPNAIAQSMAANGRGGGAGPKIDAKNNATQPADNNPIELPEKQ